MPLTLLFGHQQIKVLRFNEHSWQPHSIIALCNKDNSNQIKETPWKSRKRGLNKVQHNVWGCLLTHMAFYPGKCCSAARYIFIAGSLATALPRLSYFMQSTPAKKQKNMSRLIILGVILHFTSSTYVHVSVLWMCSSNSWTDESHRSAGALCHLFSTLRQRRKWEGRLDNKDLTVTCKVHCKHSISPTTRGKWGIQKYECTQQWRK